ncbi:unnamed protein product [Meganyctiphanes norvegica]|uniref:Uncharacterized protein n=1 Tax=Meganyctiphanes norvegica TaxID=48144 RepID=A0AAV2PMY7_MEGNR
MAVITTKKASVFSIHSLKKAIKKLFKKTRPNKEKVIEEETVYKVDFETEVDDNLVNEALEARLIQMIEASPAALNLDLHLNLKGTLLVTPDAEVEFGTFWTNEDSEMSWDMCKEFFKPATPRRTPKIQTPAASPKITKT